MGTNSYVTKLKAQLDQAIIQREHWKQLAHKRNYIEVSETDPESRTESVWRVDADTVRRMWAQIRHMEAALAEQGERQEVVAWIVPDFGFLFPTEDAAQRYLRNINDLRKPTALYATPQPGPDVRALLSADDVRDACANAVSVFTEVTNADQCREVAEYMREVLLAQIARRQEQPQ